MARPIIVPREPYIVKEAVGMLEYFLRPADQVFEWGSGGSTIWMAKRVSVVATVDHDPRWHNAVMDKAKAESVDHKILFHLIDPLIVEQYADVINKYGRKWDAIIIDGPSGTRGNCAADAIKRLKPGGFIMLDNSEASKPARELLDRTGWWNRTRRGIAHINDEPIGETETGFWFKPQWRQGNERRFDKGIF